MAGTFFKAFCFLPILLVCVSAASFNVLNPKNNTKPFNATAAYSGMVEIIYSNYHGKWELVSQNSGVNAMHSILLPLVNKVLMFDSTIWRISKLPLPPQQLPCHVVDPVKKIQDCWSHSALFDIETSELKGLKLQTDTWCSSGGLTVDGNLVSTGGFQGGANTVRYLDTCENCNWREYPTAFADPRWYATQVTLEDGGFIVVGGRDAFSYEYIPKEGQNNPKAIYLPLLKETTDNLMLGKNKFFRIENNLYPFVYLVPDGNVFIFANNRSILLNPVTNQVVREYPVLPGGSRNYPASGMSAIIPIKLSVENPEAVPFEVMVCGGAAWDSFYYAEIKKEYRPALQDCGRLDLMNPNAVWVKEMMPSPRVMGDMHTLPTGDILMINGGKVGTSAWGDADEPNFVPALYKPDAPMGFRFRELTAATIPRMYHTSSLVLPDGKILVAGSNTNDGYLYNVKYPTELRVEKFSPPYLDPSLDEQRPEIIVDTSDKVIGYGQKFSIKVRSKQIELTKSEGLEITMFSPTFTTHGFSMNQRLIILGVADVVNNVWPGIHNIAAVAPPSGKVAQPGYYLLFVVYKGVPSAGMWIQIK